MANNFRHFPALIKKYGIDPKHVIHVGAHLGEEVPYYREAGFTRITLVEPIPELCEQIAELYPDVTVIQAACAEGWGRRTLTVMDRDNLSTLQSPGFFDRPVRTVNVEVDSLNGMIEDMAIADVPVPNVAVVDAQGLELAVLQHAPLYAFDLVIVETSTVLDETMASPYAEVLAYMEDRGFKEVNKWSRDYQWLFKWGRKTNTRNRGTVDDVAFVSRKVL